MVHFYGTVRALQALPKPANLKVKDRHQFRTHLDAQGITIIADTQPLIGCDRVYLRDPGGNRLEILCYDDDR